MNLIQRNTPEYFAPEEATDLSRYLDHEIQLYYVLTLDGRVVGCGGINFDNEVTGRISWDIIAPDHQGRSLGKQLLEYRIGILKSMDVIRKVIVRTSQLAYRFYERQGFVLRLTKKDYWAKGLDMYYMELEL